MDPIKILRRAWQILWSYRALWVFGLILALAGAGASGHGGGSNNGVQYQTDSHQTQNFHPEDMREAFKQAGQEMQKLFDVGIAKVGITKAELNALIWIGVAFILLAIVMNIIIAIARYVSETAVIRMVDEYESTGSKMTVRQGFRIGWSRTSWRLFLINLLVNLPAFLFLAVLLVLGIFVFFSITRSNQSVAVFSIFSSIGVMLLVLLVVIIAGIVLNLLRHFFWRVCALEDVGVRESLRRGFQMVRENWKNVGIMWLVMIGLGIAWMIVSIIAFFLLLPLVLVTGAVGVLVAAIPTLLVGGLSSFFLHGWLPWIVGGLFALPLFFIVAFSPWLLLGSWQTVFTSTVWTLVYRELKALPALTNGESSTEVSTPPTATN